MAKQISGGKLDFKQMRSSEYPQALYEHPFIYLEVLVGE